MYYKRNIIAATKQTKKSSSSRYCILYYQATWLDDWTQLLCSSYGTSAVWEDTHGNVMQYKCTKTLKGQKD